MVEIWVNLDGCDPIKLSLLYYENDAKWLGVISQLHSGGLGVIIVPLNA